MSSSVVLGVRLQPQEFQRIKLDNVDLDGKVESLRKEAADKINIDEGKIELIYCGHVLEDDKILSACGIKPGVMIHILQRKPPPSLTTSKPLSEGDIQRLVVAFKTFSHASKYRTAIQRLSRPEIMDNILAATPGLAADPVALAMLKDPEIISQLCDADTVRQIGERHPCFIEATHHIVAHIHEEMSNADKNQASTSSGYSYSLEALSDDEDMDSSDSPREATPLTRNSSYNAITAAQLAAAIANATSNANFGSPANQQQQQGGATPAPNAATSNIITSEMFGNALQQAFASSPGLTMNAQGFSSPLLSQGGAAEAMTGGGARNLHPQLQQMREMGLVNEGVNVRALQTTAGDVQAAIELVLSGAFE